MVYITRKTSVFFSLYLKTNFCNRSHVINNCQEKMRGQRGRLPVQPLGYATSTKVIFIPAKVFVLAEACFPRRPHAGQPRSDAGLMFERKAKISCNGGRGVARDLTHLRRRRRARRLVKNEFLFYFEILHLLRSIQCICWYQNMPQLNMLQVHSVPKRNTKN